MNRQFPLSLIIIASISVGFISCKKNDDPAIVTTTLLVFNPISSINFQTSSSDDWIYITDENGVLLTSKSYESDEYSTFTTTSKLPSDKINVTLFKYFKGSTSEQVLITSYLGVKINQTFTGWDTSTIGVSGSIHNVLININNIPLSSLDSFGASSLYESVGHAALNSTVVGNLADMTYSFSPLSVAPSLYLSAPNAAGQPVFLEVANLPNLSTVTVDFNNFKNVDHSVSFSFPGAETLVCQYFGIRKKDSTMDPYLVRGGLLSRAAVNGTDFKVGYNDGFDVYKTSLSASYGNVIKTYNKSGQISTSMPLLNRTFSTISNSIKTFSFTISDKYDNRVSLWLAPVVISGGVTRTLSWTIKSSPDGKQNMDNVISEIIKTYPNLSLDNLTYTQTVFTVYLSPYTYDLGPAIPANTPIEYQTITFQP